MVHPAATPLRPLGLDGRTHSDRARRVLSIAVVEAARLLEVNQTELSSILGVSTATVSRLAAGEYLLQPERKEWELAVLFVRLFRSLDSITGGREDHSRAWLRSDNRALQGVPADLIRKVESLVRVVQYLDASRATV